MFAKYQLLMLTYLLLLFKLETFAVTNTGQTHNNSTDSLYFSQYSTAIDTLLNVTSSESFSLEHQNTVTMVSLTDVIVPVATKPNTASTVNMSASNSFPPMSVTPCPYAADLNSTADNITQTPGARECSPSQSASVTTVTNLTTQSYNTEWMDTFFNSHHFDGLYMFDGVKYLFDFVVQYQHPLDSRTLVARFYDQDGAILEMNGISKDGHVITFTKSRLFSQGKRFPSMELFELIGILDDLEGSTTYAGNITKPENSSFTWFEMNRGLGTIETNDIAGTHTVIIIIIPTMVAFVAICATVIIICWASRKGYLLGRHKSYRLFVNTQISYECEAETIHI